MLNSFIMITILLLSLTFVLSLYFSIKRIKNNPRKTKITQRKISKRKEPTYHCSTELLYRLSKVLITKDGLENLCHVTGIRIGPDDIVLTSIITPKMSKRSYCYAEGDSDSLTQHLLYLSNFNHAVFLQAHRHPGRGILATHPSSTDHYNHRIWEVCYPMIGAIFVEDGYFRFFSHKKQFNIKIHGKGVTKIDGTRYKFDN